MQVQSLTISWERFLTFEMSVFKTGKHKKTWSLQEETLKFLFWWDRKFFAMFQTRSISSLDLLLSEKRPGQTETNGNSTNNEHSLGSSWDPQIYPRINATNRSFSASTHTLIGVGVEDGADGYGGSKSFKQHKSTSGGGGLRMSWKSLRASQNSLPGSKESLKVVIYFIFFIIFFVFANCFFFHSNLILKPKIFTSDFFICQFCLKGFLYIKILIILRDQSKNYLKII